MNSYPSNSYNLSETILWIFGIIGTIDLVVRYSLYFWKNKHRIAQPIVTTIHFGKGAALWIHSDFFFLLSLVFLRIRHYSTAKLCSMQAMKTIGTLPFLYLGHSLMHDDEKSQPIKTQCDYCKFFNFIKN